MVCVSAHRSSCLTLMPHSSAHIDLPLSYGELSYEKTRWLAWRKVRNSVVVLVLAICLSASPVFVSMEDCFLCTQILESAASGARKLKSCLSMICAFLCVCAQVWDLQDVFVDERCDCRGFGDRLWVLIRDRSVLRLNILGIDFVAHLGLIQSVGDAQRALA